MFAYILMCVSGCLSKMLARTHACIYTHVGRDDRLDCIIPRKRRFSLDVGLREEERVSGTSADGGHSEGRCPRRAGQRGVKCVLGGGEAPIDR